MIKVQIFTNRKGTIKDQVADFMEKLAGDNKTYLDMKFTAVAIGDDIFHSVMVIYK